MKNKDIEKAIKAICPKAQWGHKEVNRNTVFALIKYKETKTSRKYTAPYWAINYSGLTVVHCVYPEDFRAKLIVASTIANTKYFVPHAREVLRILTLEEVQNEFPEYLI